jgi:hypothetical protein
LAIHHGVDFVSIEVPRELRGEDPDFGEVVGGGLDMGRPPRDWVPAEPARALEILAAGYLAEDTLLGHHLPGSFAGDLTVWRLGTGLTDGGSDREGNERLVEETLGEAMADLMERVRTLVTDSAAIIMDVANALRDAPDWSLSHARIGQVIGDR